jgi:hypothetical protein
MSRLIFHYNIVTEEGGWARCIRQCLHHPHTVYSTNGMYSVHGALLQGRIDRDPARSAASTELNKKKQNSKII